VTIHGWDASHYDAPPTARDGIDFYTHKAAEGHRFYRDAEYGPALNAARALGVPVLGSYFVNHPGTVADQADWWVSIVNADTPWWRTVPWIWQIDAEKFSYMDRAPSLAEINALGDAICARTGSPASSVVAYAPKWLYGDNLKGLKYRLWASNYGSNPAVPYRQAYPGDSSSRWAVYSGQTPIILQYGSRTTIAGQTTCDANAYRGTVAQLIEQIGGPVAQLDDQEEDMAPLLLRIKDGGQGADGAIWYASPAGRVHVQSLEQRDRLMKILGISAVTTVDSLADLDVLAPLPPTPVSLAPVTAQLTEVKAAVGEVMTGVEGLDAKLDQSPVGNLQISGGQLTVGPAAA